MSNKNIRKENDVYNQKLIQKLDDIYKYTIISENKVDDKIYKEISKTLLKYSEVLKNYYTETLSMCNFLEQYINLSSKLIIKYNKNNNENIHNINNFINLYVNENLDYKYFIYKEFKKIGIIEERTIHETYVYDSFKKILQVLSPTYRKDNITPPELMYKNSKINEIQQKAKQVIKYIIDINKRSKLINQTEVIRPTTIAMEIISVLPDIIVDNEEDLKKLIDGLYKLFWDNSQKIREYALNNELDFINSLRRYYYHDLEHGEERKVRKKFIEVKEIYKESCGKFIPETAKDWQKIQEYIYDKLILFLSNIEIKEKIEVES